MAFSQFAICTFLSFALTYAGKANEEEAKGQLKELLKTHLDGFNRGAYTTEDQKTDECIWCAPNADVLQDLKAIDTQDSQLHNSGVYYPTITESNLFFKMYCSDVTRAVYYLDTLSDMNGAKLRWKIYVVGQKKGSKWRFDLFSYSWRSS